MAFSPAFLDELRRRLSIIDIVGRKVRLTRRGRQASGLCPFHREKSPSFHVYDEADPHYHCFGCGAHGDVITFVIETGGLGFRDAVEMLAQEAGLPVPQDTPEERARAERQASLGDVMELACRWFEAALGSQEGRQALDYLTARGLNAAAIKRFRLGYAPNSREALKAKLIKEAVPLALAVEAGLLIAPEAEGKSDAAQPYDRFRGRVIFPILDGKGRVIGFGGRTLGDDKPKYLNSPETPLFHKGRVLYGLSLAQKPARDKGEVIVAEGYMDVIALAEAGFPQAVAPLGTALTEEQINLLWRLAPEPILCFDGDAAGIKAAERAAERALPILKPGFSLRFAWMPPGEDPDSLARKAGAGAVRAVLDAAEPLVEMVWKMTASGRLLNTPERRSGFKRDLLALAGRINDRAVQEAYRDDLRARLNALYGGRPGGMGAGAAMAGGAGAGARTSGRFRRTADGATFGMDPGGIGAGGMGLRRGLAGLQRKPYEIILAAVLHHPELLHRHGEQLAMLSFPAGELDKLRTAIIDHAARDPQLDTEHLKNHLREKGFLAALDGLLARASDNRFTLPTASLHEAEEGFLHVLAMLRDKTLGVEMAAAAQALRADMTEEAWARFLARQAQLLEGETQRRDLDGEDTDVVRGRKE